MSNLVVEPSLATSLSPQRLNPHRPFTVRHALLKISGQPVGLVQNVTITQTQEIDSIFGLTSMIRVPLAIRNGPVIVGIRQFAILKNMLEYLKDPQTERTIEIVFKELNSDDAPTKSLTISKVRLSQASFTADAGTVLIYKDVTFEGLIDETTILDKLREKNSNQKEVIPVRSVDYAEELKDIIPLVGSDISLVQGLSISFAQNVERILSTTGRDLAGFYLGVKVLIVNIRTLLTSANINNNVINLATKAKLTGQEVKDNKLKASQLGKLASNFRTFYLTSAHLSYDSNGILVYNNIQLEAYN